MPWNEILNHQSAFERFQRTIERNRLASTYLFVGPPGIGKRTFALKLALALLCETNSESPLMPCNQCQGCKQALAETHPDLILVSRPAKKSIIPLEAFIGDKEHRRQEGLCHAIGLKPFRGGRKIAIIDDADYLNQEGANSLLKTLEEPPPMSLLILIGTSEQRQLSTIVSRSQIVRFDPLSQSQVLEILNSKPIIEQETISFMDLANASAGSLSTAILLSDPDCFEFRQRLFQQLASRDPGQNEFTKTIIDFAESAGKENSLRRDRLILVADFAITFYRQWILTITKAQVDTDRVDPKLAAMIENEFSDPPEDVNQTLDQIAQCIERCTEMQRQVRANAGFGNLVDSWVRELGWISRGSATPNS
jgi:DNA polymerase-3 subunit delta'